MKRYRFDREMDKQLSLQERFSIYIVFDLIFFFKFSIGRWAEWAVGWFDVLLFGKQAVGLYVRQDLVRFFSFHNDIRFSGKLSELIID